MTDTEKVDLIHEIINDFWEFKNEEQRKHGAIVLVNAITSVVEFRRDGDG